MLDDLQRYRDKRNFKVTSEPQGGRARAGAPLSFVIQKHAARQLHYDFRLELNGTLKSWAVPKGPSLDPHDKRMAVHVEDHPLDYANFEGVIPPKQYGAGTVIVWDRGEWIPVGDPMAGYQNGKLSFELRGHKLSGHWALVRMRGRGSERQEPWLLIKERDEAARPAAEFNVIDEQPDSVLSALPPVAAAPRRPTAGKSASRTKAGQSAPPDDSFPPGTSTKGWTKAPLPLTMSPQLATLVDAPPTTGEWLYELKFDGYRLLARVDGADVKLFTRNGHDWASRLKGLTRALKALRLPPCWLDGEIVVQGPQGTPDFQLLQNAFDSASTELIQYFVFDAPYAGGYDLRPLALKQRRAVVRHLMARSSSPQVLFSEDFAITPQSLLHTACELRMEGLIGKLADAPYATGRSPSWIKLKCTQRQEFVIAGYTDPKGSRTGLGSLLLGVHEDTGQLRYAGNVGTGFNEQVLRDVSAKLAPLTTDKCPFSAVPRGIKPHWVRPKLVAEVSFAQWTSDGKVRHAVFHGLRRDKPAKAIGREKPVPVKVAAKAANVAAKAAVTAPSARSVPALLAGLRLTHPDRVIDASTGITKQDLAEYYARAASKMLPHLVRRPVALVRGPTGVGGELFFQKHAAKLNIPGIKFLDPAFDPDHDPLLEVANREALLGSVQMNVIEFHTWNATTRAIEKPDRMTFDLDPGEGLAWADMLAATDLLRALLEELDLRSFLKTSGGKGLHVVVPLKPGPGWDTVKGVSQAIVTHLAHARPDRFVAKSGARNRVGKIFVDYLRNGRGATTAAAWSVRARPGMGVSVPVGWDELTALTSGAHWTLRTAAERLDQADDPWAGYAECRQSLRVAMKELAYTGP